MEITWSNRIGNRSRRPFLLLIRGDEISPFTGESIPGVCVVKGTDYTKAGKWSETIYRIETAENIRAISGYDGWESGRFVEGLGRAVDCKTPDTWSETANALGVSVPSAMEFLREWRPKAAEKLDEVEQAIEDLEDYDRESADSIIVTVSFGSPTNRQISEGWWDAPKRIPGCDGAEIRLINPKMGWQENNIEVVGIKGTVISVIHSRGRHGGYYAVNVALIPME